ncbi:hypothetical protein MVEN_02342600 [Mycena venus]|uniref:DUF6534 domain-containing protein n=1 Tax=Mycena venus TaxID=2733690 RepID=A0A8H6X4G9_9AGAR|nr:hypothetical protein MVEN_02342600 [Mycena venus]
MCSKMGVSTEVLGYFAKRVTINLGLGDRRYKRTFMKRFMHNMDSPSFPMPQMPQMGSFTIPVLVGTLVNWALLGALFVQVYLYILAFSKDKLWHKFLVGFIVIAEILQTLGDSRDAVRVFGDGWGDLRALELVGWAWFSVPVIGSTIACVGQLFFAWRIFSLTLGNNWYIPGVIVSVTLFQFAAGIWTGVLICQAETFIQLQFRTLKPPAAWLAATALSDLMIVAATTFYVIQQRTPDLSRRTHALLSRILKVTVETGVLCAIFAIVNLCLFMTYDGNNYHLGICIWLSKVYSNSIMVIMNSRAYIGHVLPPGASQPTELVFRSFSSPSAALHVAVETTQAASTDCGTLLRQSVADKQTDV